MTDIETTLMKFAILEEVDYLKAIVRAKIEGLQLYSQSEVCLWIITIYPTSFFNQVVKEVLKNSEKWEKLDETERYLQFCAAYGIFHNKLSLIDSHHDGPTLPSTCPVGSKDYIKYVQQISRGAPDIRTVGNALIKLMGEDELFEKTTVKPQ